MKKGEGKTLAVDFDGVIHGYSKGWQNGKIYDDPIPGSKNALTQLAAEGYTILIYSTRCNAEYWESGDDRVEDVKNYLNLHGIPYTSIHTGGKPKATMYIDDRAVSFKGEWSDTLKEVDNFKTWNRPNSKSSAELEAEGK